MFGWLKRKGGDVKDYGKKVIGADEIKNNFSYIKEVSQQMLNPKSTVGKVETFEQAVERKQANPIQISKVYKNMALGFYISMGFSVLLFLLVFYFIFVKGEILPSLSTLAILFLCLVNAFKFSFRAYQIKHKKLYSIKHWWENFNEWFPKL